MSLIDGSGCGPELHTSMSILQLPYLTRACLILSQDVGGSAKDFGYLSGKYSMDLVVGDAVIQNPFSWPVVSISYTFSIWLDG